MKTKRTMTLAVAVMLLLTAPALAGFDPCPCGTNPPFVCCGDIQCDLLTWNAFSSGPSCYARPFVYCCREKGAIAPKTEAALGDDLVIELVQRGDKPFDGLINRVHVRMKINGRFVPGPMGRGWFQDGFLVMESGTRYLMLAGDLFEVEE